MGEMYKNPVVLQRADPFIYKHTDGYYYFTASVPQYDRIEIRRARTIQALGNVAGVTVWRKHAAGPMSELIWAPEIHFLRGKWYIYFAAAPDKEVSGITFNHRMYVIENTAADPFTGKWQEKDQIKTSWESFSLDATVLEHNDELYYIWAQEEQKMNAAAHSNIYIAKMLNPWTLATEPVLLTQPEFDWERKLFWVNEGPAVLKKNGRLFLTYSASATDENYCIGMLTADMGSDLLLAKSWKKSKEPIFRTSYENHQYGPGHNSFTVSEDGKTDLLVYHARNYTKIEGDPLYDPNRHTRVQPIFWQKDGTPNFGVPEADHLEK
jgi:Predicted beta-xylosidase